MSYMPSDEELAQLQKLSNEYQPEVTGPLVGERQSSSVLTTEYANGDPVYVAKTRNLPQKYSHYRTCRGDGHCGWRAIAFGYFEALIKIGDVNKFDHEVARLSSMRNLLNDTGFQEILYEDFEEVMLDLLRKTRDTLAAGGDAEQVILTSFNDEIENPALSIIAYIKLLTSAHLQHNPGEFENFLLGQDIAQYCANSIEPAVCEIDHIGVSGLVNVLCKPTGIAAEVTYLDRTPGEEANVYRFDPISLHGGEQPTIRMLYRPGHYDILYKPEDLPRPVQPMTSPVHVALANNLSGSPHVDDLGAMPAWLSMIPGMSTAGGSPMAWGYSSSDFGPTPAMPTAPHPQQVVPPPAYAPLPVQPSQITQPRAPPPDFLPSPVYSDGPQMTLPLNPGPPTIERSEPFRPSVYQLEPDIAYGPMYTLPQTSQFRNSPYNKAHFLNHDFQPEEWSPDTEYVTHSEKSRSRKNS